MVHLKCIMLLPCEAAHREEDTLLHSSQPLALVKVFLGMLECILVFKWLVIIYQLTGSMAGKISEVREDVIEQCLSNLFLNKVIF